MNFKIKRALNELYSRDTRSFALRKIQKYIEDIAGTDTDEVVLIFQAIFNGLWSPIWEKRVGSSIALGCLYQHVIDKFIVVVSQEMICLQDQLRNYRNLSFVKHDLSHKNATKMYKLETIGHSSAVLPIEIMCSNLLSSNWVIRHGACLAMKTTIEHWFPIKEYTQYAIEVCTILLYNDSFIDYLGSVVFYPVRTPAAQLLAMTFVFSKEKNIFKALLENSKPSLLGLWESKENSRQHVFLLFLTEMAKISPKLLTDTFGAHLEYLEKASIRIHTEEGPDLIRTMYKLYGLIGRKTNRILSKASDLIKLILKLDENDTLELSIEIIESYLNLSNVLDSLPDAIFIILLNKKSSKLRKLLLDRVRHKKLSDKQYDQIIRSSMNYKDLPQEYTLVMLKRPSYCLEKILSMYKYTILKSREISCIAVSLLNLIATAGNYSLYIDSELKLLYFFLFVETEYALSFSEHSLGRMQSLFPNREGSIKKKTYISETLRTLIALSALDSEASKTRMVFKFLKYSLAQDYQQSAVNVYFWFLFRIFVVSNDEKWISICFTKSIDKIVSIGFRDENTISFIQRCIKNSGRTNLSSVWSDNILKKFALVSNPTHQDVFVALQKCYLSVDFTPTFTDYLSLRSKIHMMSIIVTSVTAPSVIVMIFLSIGKLNEGHIFPHDFLDLICSSSKLICTYNKTSLASFLKCWVQNFESPAIIGDPLHTEDKIRVQLFLLQLIKSLLKQTLPNQQLFIVCLVPIVTQMFIARNSTDLRESCGDILPQIFPLVQELRQQNMDNYLEGNIFLEAELKSALGFISSFFDGNFDSNEYTPSFSKIQLRTYQKEAISWISFLNKYNMNAMLCDDLGLGKSLMSLLAIEHAICKDRTRSKISYSVILCPSSLIGQWLSEIKKWFNPELLSNIFIVSPLSEVKNNSIFKTSLEKALSTSQHLLLVGSIAQLMKLKFLWEDKLILYTIVDEAHRIRNLTSKANNFIRKHVAPLSDNLLLLTGTPFRSNASDVYAYFEILMPGYFGSRDSFRKKYLKQIAAYKKQFRDFFSMTQLNSSEKAGEFEAFKFLENEETEEEKNILEYYSSIEYLNKKEAKQQEKMKHAQKAVDELKFKILPFIMRRLKSEVLKELPPIVETIIKVELTGAQKKLYESIKADKTTESKKTKLRIHDLLDICNHPQLFANKYSNDVYSAKNLIFKQAMQGRQTIISAKQEALNELLDDISEDNKVIIFVQKRRLIDLIITQVLVNFPYVYQKLEGSMSLKNREKAIRSFKEKDNVNILISTTKAGGVGLNLTEANTVILFEHNFDPFVDIQAINRTHRLGQEKSVSVFKIVTMNTIEEELLKTQLFKLNLSANLFAPESSHVKELRREAAHALLKSITQKSSNSESEPPLKKSKLDVMLDSIEDLWDEDQYQD